MNVKELVSYLKRMDPDHDVFISIWSNELRERIALRVKLAEECDITYEPTMDNYIVLDSYRLVDPPNREIETALVFFP